MVPTLLTITGLSLAIAAFAILFAVRVTRAERRRSDARVAALAADLHAGDLDLRPTPVEASTRLFAATDRPAAPGSRVATSFAIGVFVVGALAAVLVMTGTGSRDITRPLATAAPVESTAAVPPSAAHAAMRTGAAPLELVALGHGVDGGRLTVRGVVRNPASGAELAGLTALVFLFDKEGGSIGSGRAPVPVSPLLPGAETSFVVSVSNAHDVGRYRVSFRTDDRVVPHVDRRDHESVARVQ